MACERCGNYFSDDAHRNAAIQTHESCQTLSQGHEKNLASVQACEVSVLFAPPVACKGIAISCKKSLMVLQLLMSTTFATLSNLSKTKLVRKRKVNFSKFSISVASTLLLVVPQRVFVELDDSENGGSTCCRKSQFSSRLVRSSCHLVLAWVPWPLTDNFPLFSYLKLSRLVAVYDFFQ